MRFFALLRKLRPNMDFHRQAREDAAEVKSLVGSIREKREIIRKDFPISGFIQNVPPRNKERMAASGEQLPK